MTSFADLLIVRGGKDAEKALQTLVAAGCDEAQLIEFLRDCGQAVRAKRDAGEMRLPSPANQAMNRLPAKLRVMAEQIQGVGLVGTVSRGLDREIDVSQIPAILTSLARAVAEM